jgi:hypothetical protein
LIDARTITAHSPAVMQDELGTGDLPHLGNIVVLEHVFSFSETLSRWLKLPNLPIAFEHHGLAIRFPTVHFSPGLNPPAVRVWNPTTRLAM